MSDATVNETQLITDTAKRIFSDACDHALVEAAQEGEWAGDLWNTLNENGLLQIGLADSGTGLAELYAFLREAARFAVPLPLHERLLAQVALKRDAPGVALAEVTFGPGAAPDAGQIALSWPEQHSQVLALHAASGTARLLDVAALTPSPRQTMLGEPLVNLAVGSAWDAASGSEIAVPNLFGLAALGRAAQMCGGLEASLELAITYCSEREQFGRTLSKFQAIQHQLAVLAAEVAAAKRATDAAVASVAELAQESDYRASDVAVAKVRVGAAVGTGSEIAHQVHGAMGFTMEYALHQLTRRLWHWRDEYGTESDWATLLGAEVCAGDADDLWAFISSHG